MRPLPRITDMADALYCADYPRRYTGQSLSLLGDGWSALEDLVRTAAVRVRASSHSGHGNIGEIRAQNRLYKRNLRAEARSLGHARPSSATAADVAELRKSVGQR